MSNKQVFLSHSSADKKIVRRIQNDLMQHGIDVWIDDLHIPVGASIAGEIQKGLNNSEFLLLFLTPRAVESGWVEKEWQTKFFEQVSENKISVIPLLIEQCEIPFFLKGVKYADFRESYEEGLSLLLNTLDKTIIEEPVFTSIFDYTSDLMDELSDECVILPVSGRIPIVNTLKKLPRSGKHLRLDGLKLQNGTKIQSRSIYDHILSVAHSADCLFPVVEHGLKQSDAADLARCIAFHDLNEILLGDIPAYTNLTDKRRHKTRIQAEQRLRTVPSHDRERVSNEFLSMYLDTRNRASIDYYIELTADRTSKVYRFFKILDKIDPIINVWRYIHFYRNQLPSGSKEFIRRMHDFFDNPEPRKMAQEYEADNKIIDLLAYLQNKDLAARYYQRGNSITENPNLFGLSVENLKRIIEGKKLLFIENTPRREPKQTK